MARPADDRAVAIRDPAAVDGTDEERVRAFNKAFATHD